MAKFSEIFLGTLILLCLRLVMVMSGITFIGIPFLDPMLQKVIEFALDKFN